MKKSILLSALISLLFAAPIHAQEFGIQTGAQLVRGELTGYENNLTSVTAIQTFWDIHEAPNWRYGAELRYASMNVNSSIEEGWLADYRSVGNDFSVMMSLRYYFNTPTNFFKRRNSFLAWTHFGVGFHVANFQSSNTGVGIHSGSNKGDLSSPRSTQAGAMELGFGFQYYLTDTWSLSLSSGAQYTGNDFLDGVAGNGSGEDWPIYAMFGGAYHLF